MKEKVVAAVKKQRICTHNERGHEIPDPKPVVLAGGLKRPPTLQEQIQRVLQVELSRQAAEKGYETMEEADDFDCEEDQGYLFPGSKYEILEDEVPLMRPETLNPNAGKEIEANGDPSPEDGADPAPGPTGAANQGE